MINCYFVFNRLVAGPYNNKNAMLNIYFTKKGYRVNPTLRCDGKTYVGSVCYDEYEFKTSIVAFKTKSSIGDAMVSTDLYKKVDISLLCKSEIDLQYLNSQL